MDEAKVKSHLRNLYTMILGQQYQISALLTALRRATPTAATEYDRVEKEIGTARTLPHIQRLDELISLLLEELK